MTTSDPAARRGVRAAVLVAACSLSLLWVFRVQVASGFTVLLGDSLDGVIQTSLIQHWDNVFRGREPWNAPGYFYPWPDTLGYNDGYFLNGVLLAVFRAAGADAFLAAELGNMAIRATGFAGFILFAVQIMGLRFGWGVLGAVLFTLADNIAVQSLQAQLLSVSLAPLLGWLIGRALQALPRGAAAVWGSAAAVLYGAWLMTAFYMAWFMTLFTGLAGFAALVQPAGWRWGRSAGAWPLLPIGAALAVCSVPCLLVYLPKLAETGGGHSFAGLAPYAASLPDLVHLGSGNLLFGGLDRWLTQTIRPGLPEISVHTIGFAPVLLVMAALGAVSARGVLWRAGAAATVVSFALFVRVRGVTLWYWVYLLAPGASAIRVTSRYALLLDIPVVLLAMGFLASRAGRWHPAVIAAMAGLLVLEELNSLSPARLHRNSELRFLATIPPPPPACRAFYVTSASGRPDAETPIFDSLYPADVRSLYAHNVEAMLVAETLALPTVNGFASFNPPDWNFAAPGRADYLTRIGKYLLVHGVTAGMCGLDLAGRAWTTAIPPPPVLGLGESVALGLDGNASPYLDRGWSGAEPGGRWTEGGDVGMVFALPGAPAPGGVVLLVDASPFTAPGHTGSAVEVAVNGRRVAEWQPVAGGQTLQAVIPPSLIDADGGVSVRLRIAAPLAPSEVGVSADTRRLGLFVRAFRVALPGSEACRHDQFRFRSGHATTGRMDLSVPERQLAVRRAAAQLCIQNGWVALHELPLPNGRRADLLALRPDGGFVCIEVKSGLRDFLTDLKWPEYREFCDALYFAVDTSFPLDLLPDQVGVIVTCEREAELVRAAPAHPLPPARRRALLHRFATVAATRLSALEDPMITASLRAALRAE